MKADFNNPLISIITVCFNSEKTIKKTIESVLKQTYKNYEYIIIDGKSTDNTIKIVESYLPLFEGRLRYISEKDTGIYNAMNKGINNCKGELIGILNSDDFYATNTLQLVVEEYEKEKYPFIIINGDMERVDSEDNVVFRYRFSYKMIDNKECFGHPSMFAAKAVYDRIGLYDETYKLAADGEWQYRAHDDSKVRYVLVSEVFNHMREGGASDAFNYRWAWFKERSRMKIEHNKASRLVIYWQEFKSVIRTDIKNILPASFKTKMYEMRYKNR